MEVVGIVEVEPVMDGLLDHSPLAGIARRRFGGRTLLEWVVRRVTEADRLVGVVVLAGDDRLSKNLVAQCPVDVQVFHSAEPDALGKLAAAVRSLNCRSVVRVNVCHPFVDPALVDGLIAAVSGGPSCDYASYSLADGRHAADSKLGVFVEWCRGEAVLLADQLARLPAERADATRFLRTHPEVFALRMLPVPRQLDRDDLRLAIQNEEDWEDIQLILDALGPESLDWQFITSLLDRHPTIRQRMAVRNRAEARAC